MHRECSGSSSSHRRSPVGRCERRSRDPFSRRPNRAGRPEAGRVSRTPDRRLTRAASPYGSATRAGPRQSEALAALSQLSYAGGRVSTESRLEYSLRESNPALELERLACCPVTPRERTFRERHNGPPPLRVAGRIRTDGYPLCRRMRSTTLPPRLERYQFRRVTEFGVLLAVCSQYHAPARIRTGGSASRGPRVWPLLHWSRNPRVFPARLSERLAFARVGRRNGSSGSRTCVSSATGRRRRRWTTGRRSVEAMLPPPTEENRGRGAFGSGFLRLRTPGYLTLGPGRSPVVPCPWWNEVPLPLAPVRLVGCRFDTDAPTANRSVRMGPFRNRT